MRLLRRGLLVAVVLACKCGPKDGSDDPEDSGGSVDVPETCATTTDLCEGDACTWDVDIPLYIVSGSVRLDGGAVPEAAGTPDWTLLLVDPLTTWIYDTSGPATEAAYAIEVPAGAYDVYLQLAPSDTFPSSPLPAGSVLVADDVQHDVDVPLHRVAGSVRFDGGGVPGGTGDDWIVSLVDVERDLAYATSGVTSEASYELVVPAGVYDQYLQLAPDARTGTLDHPDEPLLARPALVVEDDVDQDVDVPVYLVSGSLRFDGGALPPATGDTDWTLQFVEPTRGVTITTRGPSTEAAYEIELAEGTYDVSLVLAPDASSGGIEHPDVPLLARAAVAVSDDRTLDVDVPVHLVRGSLRFDGGAVPPTPAAEDWTLSFVDTVSGVTFTTSGGSAVADYELEVATGTYAVYLQLAADPEGDAADDEVDHPDVPLLAWPALTVDEDLDFDVDAPVHLVEGVVRFDGGPVPETGEEVDWTLTFVEVTSGVTLSTSGPASTVDYAVELPTGTWDAWLDLATSDVHPDAAVRVEAGVLVDDDRTLDVNLPVVDVSGSVRFDGGAVPDAAAGNDWTIHFVEAVQGIVLSVAGPSTEASYLLEVPVGTWDVHLQLAPSDEHPEGLLLAHAGVLLVDDATLDVDVPVWEVTGTLRYDGGAIPDHPEDVDWTLAWTELTSEAVSLTSGPSTEAAYSLELPAGTYEVTLFLPPSEEHPENLLVGECLVVGE